MKRRQAKQSVGVMETIINNLVFAMRALAGGNYAITVVTACEERHVSVRIGDGEAVFPRAD